MAYVDPFESQGYYGAQGFIPNQNNGDWLWQAGAPTWARLLGPEWITPGGPASSDPSSLEDLFLMGSDTDATKARAVESSGIGADFTPTAPIATLMGSDNDFIGDPNKAPEQTQILLDDDKALGGYFKGGGSWINTKNPNQKIEYSPQGGYRQYEDKTKLAGQIAKGVVMAGLAAGFGGAGAALGGMSGLGAAGTGAMAGGAAALPGAMAGGFNTGDWGNAATGIGLGALSGGVGSYASTPLQKSLLGAAVNTAGKAATGQQINAQDTLATLAGSLGGQYLGGYAQDAAGGGMLGEIAKGATTGLSSSTIKALLSGKTPEQQRMIMALISGAGGGAVKGLRI